MSGIYSLIEPSSVITGGPAEMLPATDWGSMVGLAFANDRDNYLSTSAHDVRARVKSQRDDLYEQLTGESVNSTWVTGVQGRWTPEKRAQAEDEKILQLRAEDPDTYGKLMTSDEMEIEAKRQARESFQEYQQAMAYTPGIGKYGATMVGSMGAMMTDPIQLPFLAFGAKYGIGTSFLKAAAVEGGFSALSEAVIQPAVIRWQKEVGNQYGLGQAAFAVMAAGLGGAAISLPISAFAKLNRLSSALEAASHAEGVTPKVKAAVRELATPIQRIEDATSPDLPRHHANADLVESKARSGEVVELSEIRARITDDIEGMPAQAFDFLTPGRLTDDGVEVTKLTRSKLTAEVEKEILPRIAREIEDDIAATDLVSPKHVEDSLRVLRGRVGQLNIRLKETLKRLDDAKALEAPRTKKKTQAKQQRKYDELEDKAIADYNAQRFDLDQEIAALESAKAIHVYNKSREALLKDLKAGKLPQGQDYAAASVRKSIDRIVDTLMNNKKMAPKRPAMESRLIEDGIIPAPVTKGADDILEDLEAIDIEDMALAKEIGEEIKTQGGGKYVDDEGNLVDARRLVEDLKDENEMTAVRTCGPKGVK